MGAEKFESPPSVQHRKCSGSLYSVHLLGSLLRLIVSFFSPPSLSFLPPECTLLVGVIKSSAVTLTDGAYYVVVQLGRVKKSKTRVQKDARRCCCQQFAKYHCVLES